MRIIVSLLIAMLLLAGVSFADEPQGPPALVLDCDGITESPVTGSYSWFVPTGNPGEWSGIDACGIAPTDPAMLEAGLPAFLMEDRTYTLRWEGTPPEELTVFSWDLAVFSDPDHPEDYQENPEIVLHPADGKITLKPDRVYEFHAKWPESGESKAHGDASYYLVAEKLIMEDGPDMVRMDSWTPSADSTVTAELKALFEKGTAALTGESAEPVAYLGSQLTAGRNHAFLCRAVSAYPGTDRDPAYEIIYLYEDMEGNVSLLNIADFDIGAFCTYGWD